MREVVANQLWIGNAVEANAILPVTELDVRAVIDLAMNERPVAFPREIIYCRFPLVDGSGNDPAVLRAAISTTSQFFSAEVPTFVYCSAGMSRSPAIAAGAMSLASSMSLDDALRTCTQHGAHDVSPALWQDVCRSCESGL